MSAPPLNPQGKVEFRILHDLLNTPADVILPIVINTLPAPQAVELALIIPIDLSYFKGHFDTQPIVAGVVLIEWVAHFAAQHFELSGTFGALKQLKFHKTIAPNERVTLTLHFNSERQTVTFIYKTGEHKDIPISSGMMCWGASHV